MAIPDSKIFRHDIGDTAEAHLRRMLHDFQNNPSGVALATISRLAEVRFIHDDQGFEIVSVEGASTQKTES